jgi:hypothetical protein
MMPALMGAPRAPFTGNTNIVLDGNSMMAFVGGAYNLTWLLAVTFPVASNTPAIGFAGNGGATPVAGSGSPARKWVSNKGVTLNNLGISGQTWRKMDGLDGYSSADVDGAFVPGAFNILWAWEGTNSIAGGASGMQAVSDATTYIAHRRAANPWNKIIGGTVPPRMDSSSDQTLVSNVNAQIDIYNAYLLANYKAMGFDAVFDVRQAGSPFNLPNYLLDTFNTNAAATATSPYWASDSNGIHVHLSNIGNDYVIRQCLAPVIRRLRRK